MVDVGSLNLVFLTQCSLLVKWQLGAEGRIRANIGSSPQLKHHCKNCLSLSVMLLCAITNLTILENAGTENGSSVSNFCFHCQVSINNSRSGNEDQLPHDESCSMAHGCEGRFGPGRRRGMISCLVFVNAKLSLK